MIVLNCDLTMLKVDIIVNAANKTLLGGGGVDGIIHRKAGPNLREECMKLNGCEVGDAKITDAYNLPCNKIIHTVGPIYRGGIYDEEKSLSDCYINSMMIAEKYRNENNLNEITIAFPCISTGAFGYPKDKAALVAFESVKKINNKNIKVIFACFEETDYQLYVKNVYGIDIEYFS